MLTNLLLGVILVIVGINTCISLLALGYLIVKTKQN